jgi:hypothetical protein
MNLRCFQLSIFLGIIGLIGCKKDKNPSAAKNVDVYVAGISTSVNYKVVATYWKNGIAKKIADSSVNSLANSVAVLGSDVYIAGEVDGAAVLWKNGIATTLSANGTANTVVVNGNDVYVGGAITQNGLPMATYWKNGNLVAISDSVNAFVTAIAISGNDVYLAGFITPSYGNVSAMVWKNGAAKRLTDGSFWAQAFGIAVNGTDIYVSGIYYNNSNNRIASYWKNGVLNNLTDNSSYSSANAAIVNNGSVYIAGSTRPNLGNEIAVFWQDGAMTSLSKIPQNFITTDIIAGGNDIYTSGYLYTPGSPSILTGSTAYYWKNGIAIKLPQGLGGSAEALAIALGYRP